MPSRQDIKRLSRPYWDSLGTGLTVNPGDRIPAGVYDSFQLLDQIHGFNPGNLGFGKPVYIGPTPKENEEDSFATHSYSQAAPSWPNNDPDVKSSYGIGNPKFEGFLRGETAGDLYFEDKETGQYIKNPYNLAETFGHEMLHNITAVLPNVTEEGVVANIDPVLQMNQLMNPPTGYKDKEHYYNPNSDLSMFGGFEVRSVPTEDSAYISDLHTKNQHELEKDIYEETMSNLSGVSPEISHAYATYASKQLTSPDALKANKAYNIARPKGHVDYRMTTDEILARGIGDATRYWTDPDIGTPGYTDWDRPYSLNDETLDAAEELMYQMSLGLKGEGLINTPTVEGTDFSPNRGDSQQSITKETEMPFDEYTRMILGSYTNLDRAGQDELMPSNIKVNTGPTYEGQKNTMDMYGDKTPTVPFSVVEPEFVPDPYNGLGPDYFNDLERAKGILNTTATGVLSSTPATKDVTKDMTEVSINAEPGFFQPGGKFDTLASFHPAISTVYGAFRNFDAIDNPAARPGTLTGYLMDAWGDPSGWMSGIMGESAAVKKQREAAAVKEQKDSFMGSLDSGSYTNTDGYSYGTIDGIGVEDPY